MATWEDIQGWLSATSPDATYDNLRVRERKPWNPTTYKRDAIFSKNLYQGDFSDVGKDWNVQYYTGGDDPKWETAGTWADYSAYEPEVTVPEVTKETETYTVQLTDGSIATYAVGFGPFPHALAGDIEKEKEVAQTYTGVHPDGSTEIFDVGAGPQPGATAGSIIDLETGEVVGPQLSDTFASDLFWTPKGWSPFPLFTEADGSPQVKGIEYDRIPFGATYNFDTPVTSLIGGWLGAYENDDDRIKAAREDATTEFDPDSFQWFKDAVVAFTEGTQELIDAWQEKYAHFGTDLTALQDEMPEFPDLDVDYAEIDRLLGLVESGPTDADRSAAREEVAQNFGYNTWDEFQTKLGEWESSTVNTPQVEKDAARQMGYDSWDDYQTALKGMGYTELTPEAIREIAAKDMGFNTWAEYQGELASNRDYTSQTDAQINDSAAQAMGFDTWDEYKAALDAVGSYTYATDDELRERTAKDLGFNTWDEFQAKQRELQDTALSDPDITQAEQETARSLGFDTSDEMRAEIERLRGALESGDVAGLTDEERDVYERQRSQAVRQAERRANDQMEAVLGNTGSMTQYLAAADEANNRIIDTNLKYEMAEMNQDMALQTETLDRMMSIYTGLFEGQEQGINRSMDRQIRQLEIANQQFLTQLKQAAAQIQGYGKLDIEKAELAEQRYGTLMGNMSAQQGRFTTQDLAREGMATDRYNTLLTTGGDRIGDLTTAELTRTGQADARAANLRTDYTSAYGTIMAAEIERVRGDTTKFIELVKAGNAGVQDILKMKQNGVMAALTGYFERANMKIFEYGEEVDGISAQADMVYKGAMMQLGIDQGVFDIVESEFNLQIKPIVNLIAVEMQEQAYDAAPFQLVVDALAALRDIVL